ncbi:hypothetical protein CBM2606_A60069 [Cupriavidus taiwanensis]|nr:hypothetical protein CBM2606_A60069 [Cupriavidus taiwanensis]
MVFERPAGAVVEHRSAHGAGAAVIACLGQPAQDAAARAARCRLGNPRRPRFPGRDARLRDHAARGPGRHLDHRRHHCRVRHPAPQRPGPLGRELVPRRARRRPVWRGAGTDVLWRIHVCAPHRRIQDRAGGAVRVPRQPRRGDDRLPAGNRPPGLAGCAPHPPRRIRGPCARGNGTAGDQSVAVRQIGAGALGRDTRRAGRLNPGTGADAYAADHRANRAVPPGAP